MGLEELARTRSAATSAPHREVRPRIRKAPTSISDATTWSPRPTASSTPSMTLATLLHRKHSRPSSTNTPSWTEHPDTPEFTPDPSIEASEPISTDVADPAFESLRRNPVRSVFLGCFGPRPLVPEKLLDRLQRRAAHDEMRREGVTKDVPADEPDPGALAGGPERPLAAVTGQHVPGLVAEDQLATKMTVRLEPA